MFKYFTKKRKDTQFPIKKYTQFDYVKKRYLTELSKVVNYYREKEKPCLNTHVISRLIETIVPDISMDIIDYLNIVSATSKHISSQFHITSNINKGNVLNKLFYKDNANEILLYVENDLDLTILKNNFKDVSPIRVIYSEDSDLDYYVPYATKSMKYESLFVYEIDVIQMLLQYRYWALDRKANGLSNDINLFVGSIIIPNLTFSLFDFSLFNRFLNLIKGIPNTKPKNIHVFDIVNFSSTVDDIYKKIYLDIKEDRIPLEFTLKAIPTVVNENAYELLKINSRFNTMQNEWVIWLSRVNIIYDLLVLMNKSGKNANTELINTIPFMLRTIKNRETNFDRLPQPIFLEFQDTLEKIKNTL